MKNMSPELFISLVIPAALFVLIAVIAGISGYVSCNSYSDMTERQTKYSIVSGCYVKTDKGYVPQEEMSKRAIAAGLSE